MRTFCKRSAEGVVERREDFSAKTKISEEFFTREIFEEHLADGEAKSLPLERLDYQKEAERILELYIVKCLCFATICGL
jgi:hypothetical protein